MHFVVTLIYRTRLILAALIVLALILGAYWYGQRTVYLAHPSLVVEDESSVILGNVGQLIQLPGGEQPQMATINDAAAVKAEQPFLKDAENGDVLIVYVASGMALLYRPSANKLITVGPVDSTEPKAATARERPKEPVATTTHDTATSTSE